MYYNKDNKEINIYKIKMIIKIKIKKTIWNHKFLTKNLHLIFGII